MRVAAQDENGNPIVRDATPEEIAAMQPEPVVWHADLPVRVRIPDAVKLNWLIMKSEHEILGNHPEVVELFDLIKTIDAPKFASDGNIYLYLNEIYPEHKAVIERFGGFVETKP